MASLITKSQNELHFFSKLQKRFVFFILSSLIVFAAKADCNIAGSVLSSSDPLSGCSGVITISGTLTIDNNYDVSSYGITSLVVTGTGTITWSGDNIFNLPANVPITVASGGVLSGSGPCNNLKVIQFGGITKISCDGTGSNISFAEVMANGGFQEPRLSLTVNSVNVVNNNDGVADAAAFSVCNTTVDNVFFDPFVDLNGVTPGALVKVIQDVNTTNVTFGPGDGTFLLSDYSVAFNRNAQLIDPTTAGTLTMSFTAFLDLDNDNILDANESASDAVIYTVTVYPEPVLTATINGVTVATNNDGINDTGSFPVCNSTSNNIFFTAFADLNASVPVGSVKVSQSVMLNNVTTLIGDGVFPIGIYTTPFDRNVQLVNPLVNGSLTMKFVTFFDADGDNIQDIDECASDSMIYVVNVNALPIVDAGAYAPVCIDELDIPLVGTPPGGSFTGVGVMGDLFDPNAGTQIITYTYTDINGCTNSDTALITVNPLPIVDPGVYPPVCIDAADVVLVGAPVGGIFSGVGVTGNLFDPSVGTQVITYTYTDLFGCTASADVTITVNPLPTPDAGTYGPVCENDPDVLLVGAPLGGVFAGVGVFGNAFDPNSGTQVITYTVIDLNGCVGTDVATITVNPTPALSVTVNSLNLTSNNDGLPESGLLSVCNSVSNNLFFTVFDDVNNVTPADSVKVIQSFTLLNVNFAPANSTFPISAYGTPFDRNVSLVNPLLPGVLTMNFVAFLDLDNDNILDPDECASDAINYIVTVNPIPLVDAGAYFPVCIDALDIPLVGTPPGGTFSGIGVTGNLFDPSSGTQIITYAYTDGNGCSNSDTALITVNPLPIVDAGVYAPICADAADVVLVGSPLGGIFTGVGVTGNLFDPSSGTQIITYTYTDINGCTASDTALITVNPLPIVDAGTYGPFCMGDPDVLLIGTPPGGIFTGIGITGNFFDPSAGMQLITYTYIDANGCTGVDTTTIMASPTPALSITVNTVNVTNNNNGIPDSGGFSVCDSPNDNLFFTLFDEVNGAMPAGLVKITQSFTLVNVNFAPTNSTFPISAYGTPFDRNVSLVNPLIPGLLTMNFVSFLDLDNDNIQDPGECASDPVIFDVVVNPLPVVDAGAYAPVCIDAADVVLVGTPPGGVFTGIGVTANLFDPSVGTQIITYTYTDSLGCTGSDTALITVNPLPVVDAGADVTVCIDAPDVVLAGTPLGGIFSGTGVTGNLFDPSFGTQVITYTYTDANGCTGVDVMTVFVNPLPIVDAGTYPAVCQGAPDVILSGTPPGGVFTGIGVTGNLFDPTVGTQVITYTFTDANGCSASDDVTINVSPTPALSVTLNGVNVTNNNDGINDTGAFGVCDSPADNLFFTLFTDVNSVSPAVLVKVTQQFTLNNVVFTPPNSTFQLSAYGTPFDRNVQLVNPNLPGTLIMDFISFLDLNNNDIIDGDECASDHIVYTINVNPLPNANIIAPASVCANSTGNIAFVADAGVGANYNWVLTNGTVTFGQNTNSILFTAGPSGTVVIDITVTDGNGCVDTDTETVTIGNLPAISCIGSFAATNDPDECNSTQLLTHPVPTGTCVPLTVDIAFSAGIPAPSTLPIGGIVMAGGSDSYDFFVGQTIVTYTVTDFSGSTASCTFTVTVTDTQLPVISCPGPLLTANIPGTCGGIINYTTPVGTDNCPGSVTIQTTGLPSGSIFPVGVTVNTFMVTDASGNTATCSFTATVQDIELPAIVCPGAIVTTNDPGICGAAVIYVTPVGTDNCPGAVTIQTQGVVSGGIFPVGVTTNIFLVTDASGNTATCSFNVTVTDDEDPTIPLCPPNQSLIAIDPACTALASWVIPIPADNCGVDSFGFMIAPPTPIIEIAGNASGEFGVGVTTMTYIAIDLAGNTATCEFTITVTDDTDPIITGCPAPIVINNAPGLCSAIAIWTAPTASDNCPGVSLVTNHNPGESFPVGVTMVLYTATDASGNTTTCAFTVTVLDDEDPTITCPANIVQANDLGLCSAVVNYVAPVGLDNCSGAVTTQIGGLASGSVFPFGPTVNTFLVTDASGNTATCSFTVTVTDTELPVITCPLNIVASNDTGLCSAVVVFANAIGTDNCPGSFVTQIGGLVSGSAFPVGVSVVTFQVTDASGNTATCSFTITVNDTELPAITCPPSIMQSNDPGLCSAVVNFVAPIGTDNCPGSVTIQTAGLPSGSVFMVGQTVNIFQVTDASGNTSTCSFTVQVNETQPPAIVCPANIVQGNDPGLCSAIVNYVAPIGTDNCPGAVTIQTGGLASGAVYPVGVTVNTFMVTDASGNTATCSFTVTVDDTQLPSIICPTNIVATNDTLLCSALVIYVPPTGTDNCPGSVTTQIGGIQTGGIFPVGVTVNTFMVTDASGNTATCSFTVTVTDDDLPTITCPLDITVENDTLLCGAFVFYNTPVGFDNCTNPITVQTSGFPSGSFFPVGVTTNVFEVSDTSGNVTTCSFTVTVNDTEAPLTTCPINIIQGNDQDVCKAWVNFLPVFGIDNCDPNVDIYYWADGATVYGGPDILGQSNDGDPTNDPILGQATPNWYNVGVTNVHYFGVDDAGNVSIICNFTIEVVDTKIPVVITCPPSRNVFVNPGTCAGTVPNMVGEVIYSDNCTATVTQSPAAGTFFGAAHNATQVVTFTVTDIGGNTATCTLTLTLKDNIAPVIATCPPNRNIPNNLGACNGTVPNLLPELIWSDNCPSATVTQFPAAGTIFGTANNDTIHIIFVVKDAAGNVASCITILTLKDNQAPTIVCPPNQTAPCSPPVVQVPQPVVADNCGVVSVVNSFNGTNNASGIYPMGSTVVVWTVTDVNGNTATCSHTITLAPASTVTVTGQGTYCHNGFVSNLTASSATPGTFAWYYNAAGTIPVNPLQVSGPNNSVFTPTGNLGLETVFVILTNPATGCSSLPTAASVNIINCTVVLTDPCQCKNNATNLVNGQFDETMTIVAPPGQNWYVISVNGLFKTTSPAPPAAPTPLSIGVAGTDKPVETIPGMYVFSGVHVDAIGYTITFANGLGDTLTVSNVCYYPNPVITGLFPDYCQNHPPITLTGNALPQLPESQRFDLYDITNTIPIAGQQNITQLNPAAIAPGVYTLRYTFDAVDNIPTPQYPGCVSTVTQQVSIFPNPPADLVCGSLSNVSLDVMGMAVIGADMILQGNYGCFSQYQVDIEGALTNKVSCADIGKTYKVTITDPFTGNKCWGNIKVEDKLKPVIICADVTVSCNNDGLDPNTIGFPIISDNCTVVPSSIKHTDQINDLNCTGQFSAIITRQWTAMDQSGNAAIPCTQTISIKRGTLAEVVFPPNLDDKPVPSLSCENPNTSPANTGVPTIDGKPIEKFCELMVAPFSDVVIPICENSYKILRTWTVMDACSNNMITAVQIILVKDKVGPTLTCPQPGAFTYSVSGNGITCEAIVNVPSIQIQDNCSSASNVIVKTRVISNGIVTEINGNGGIINIPFGIQTFVYSATDNCGNTSTCSVDVNIAELEPPIAVCQQFTIVSLTNPTTLVNAASFDDGSYDECGGPVTLTVRRMDNPNCPGNDSTDFAPTVPFHCCDVNNGPVMVVLRVTDASGNFNDCMVEANVVDKLKPTIICPADLTLQCGDPTDPSIAATYSISKLSTTKISNIFAQTYYDTVTIVGLPSNAKISDINLGLNLTHEYIDQLTIKLKSPTGTVINLFQGGTCGQFKQDINATFDDEGVAFFCNGAGPAITGNVKPQISQMSYLDGENPNGKWILQIYDNAPLGGGKVNSISLNISYNTPISNKPIVTDNTLDCGVAVNWVDLNTPGQCLGNSFINRQWIAIDSSGNSRTCIQHINLVDNTPLDIDFPDDVTITDCTKLDSLAGPEALKHSGDCELVAVEIIDEVFNIVPDACYKIIRTWKVLNWCIYDPSAPHTDGGINVDSLKYDFSPLDSVFNNEKDSNKRILRDDGDGYFLIKQVIKVIDQVKPEFNTCPVDTIILTSAPDCDNNPISITKLATDACTPQGSLKYTWKVDIGGNGNFDLSGTGPTMNATLPLGLHNLWFRVEDGCGNFDICQFNFTVVDGKKPTPVCVNGLSTDLMITGMVVVWAEDFNASSFDNCTAQEDLVYSFSSDTTDQFITFNCDSLGSIPVNIWVTDEAGNQDFCQTFILVTDNLGACGDTIGMKSISGTIMTEQAAKVGEAQVQLAGSVMPAISTNNTGTYAFPLMNTGGNYTVVPTKDDNVLNGVSTLDMVLITNHILGKKALDSPYKLLAADVNNTKNITTADLAEIRRVILHIKPKFTNMPSWRFLDKNFKFPDPKNPWKTALPEVYNIPNLNNDMVIDFIGMKMGDVNGNVKASAAAKNEVRNAVGTLKMMVEEQSLVKDQVYRIPVKAGAVLSTIGFQYTMEFDADALEFISTEAADLAKMDQENFGLSYLDEGIITSSWNGPVTDLTEGTTLFFINFKAKDNVRLSKSLKLSSKLTTAEAYTKDGELMDVQLGFSENEVLNAQLELMQNVPNPFNEFTKIGFNLPEAGYAQIVVSDMSGKVVKMVDGEFAKGYNELRFSKTEIGSNGIYYYQLNTPDGSETKKMIIIE